VAGGKSLVADQFRQLGAEVLDADRAGHEALRQPAVLKAARQRWGGRVFGADNQINRAALARVVFAPPPDGPRERQYLEQLTHPEIRKILEQKLAACVGKPAAVLDAALLLEAGWDKLCDKIVFVETPQEIREGRAKQRGWSAEEFVAREAAQMPLEAKRARANAVIDNSGTPDETRAQVNTLWKQIIKDR
jgi:dephospho-CoA kinase